MRALKSGERVMRSAPNQISQGRIDGCLPEENHSSSQLPCSLRYGHQKQLTLQLMMMNEININIDINTRVHIFIIISYSSKYCIVNC